MDMIQLQMRKMALDRGHSLKYADDSYANLLCMQSFIASPSNAAIMFWNHVKNTPNPFLALEAIEKSFTEELWRIFNGERA